MAHRLTCGRKDNLEKHQKVSKYYENDCLQTLLLLFMSSLRVKFVESGKF